MIHINNKFAFGDTVKLRIGDDKGIVIGISKTWDGAIFYEIRWQDRTLRCHGSGELILVEAVEQQEPNA